MTPESQRIAIAAHLGATWKESEAFGSKTRVFAFKDHHMVSLVGLRYEAPEEILDVPDYLNAMHEAEKMLKQRERWKYLAEIDRSTGPSHTWTIFADAQQRAEAFLKAIGKWTDS